MTTKDCGDDIRRLSEAMDVLAKLVLEQRKEGGSLQLEYQRKIDALDKLINMILRLPKKDGELGDWEVDKMHLAGMLRDGIEIIERPDKKRACNRKYALVPVIERSSTVGKPLAKKKKNKIACSFCSEIGHTRAKCPKRIVYVSQRDS
ncbi:hypothetical protein HG536_0D02350 [Torulaspora globosa]|uniref:CCHC-type domain-containing protein n=1 Tax=Torulaspora globosa TaxID=48254 RepID=A0A7G3ZGS7_9SACH|nr:uncharacterized protein HG536_0D02350 [Torulaspora globosa]QLL32713.1 hypothetical protein HG536_0D02350 [Torulaspora globosa]